MSTTNVVATVGAYTPPVPRLEPVAPSERIGALDLLRGWALFGVLWSNLNDHYGTSEPVTALDRARFAPLTAAAAAELVDRVDVLLGRLAGAPAEAAS